MTSVRKKEKKEKAQEKAQEANAIDEVRKQDHKKKQDDNTRRRSDRTHRAEGQVSNPCNAYLVGQCRRGEDCHFEHVSLESLKDRIQKLKKKTGDTALSPSAPDKRVRWKPKKSQAIHS